MTDHKRIDLEISLIVWRTEYSKAVWNEAVEEAAKELTKHLDCKPSMIAQIRKLKR